MSAPLPLPSRTGSRVQLGQRQAMGHRARTPANYARREHYPRRLPDCCGISGTVVLTMRSAHASTPTDQSVVVLDRKLGPVLRALAVFLGFWSLCVHVLLFPESWAPDPSWPSQVGRYWLMRAISYPVSVLALWPIVRLIRLAASRWAFRIEGNSVYSRASAWRDFSFRLSEIRELSVQELTLEDNWFYRRFMEPRRWTRVELNDGRRHHFFDRYVVLPENADLISILTDGHDKALPQPMMNSSEHHIARTLPARRDLSARPSDVMVTTGSGFTWEAPSEDLIFELLNDIEQGREAFLIIDDRSQDDHYYIQTTRSEAGTWDVAQQHGDPELHFVTSITSKELVHEALTRWAFGMEPPLELEWTHEPPPIYTARAIAKLATGAIPDAPHSTDSITGLVEVWDEDYQAEIFSPDRAALRSAIIDLQKAPSAVISIKRDGQVFVLAISAGRFTAGVLREEYIVDVVGDPVASGGVWFNLAGQRISWPAGFVLNREQAIDVSQAFLDTGELMLISNWDTRAECLD